MYALYCKLVIICHVPILSIFGSALNDEFTYWQIYYCWPYEIGSWAYSPHTFANQGNFKTHLSVRPLSFCHKKIICLKSMIVLHIKTP